MGTAASTTVQELRVLLKSGAKAGEVVRLDNDLVVLSVGDDIFVDHFWRLMVQNIIYSKMLNDACR